MTETRKSCKEAESLWNNFKNLCAKGLNGIFYSLGSTVAHHPWRTIFLTWLSVAFISLGLLALRLESHTLKTLLPADSKFVRDTDWFFNNFDELIRTENVIIQAPNVLEPKVLRRIEKITTAVESLTVRITNETVVWSDVCLKIPLLGDLVKIHQYLDENSSEELVASESHDERDPSVTLEPVLFCGIVNSLKQGCLQMNILDMWKRHSTELSTLTLANVIDQLNRTQVSQVTGHVVDFTSMLGRTHRNETGVIVSGQALKLTWLLSVNLSKVSRQDNEEFVGGDDWATENVLAWELAFNKELKKQQGELTAPDFTITYSAQRSLGDAKWEFVKTAKERMAFSALAMFVFIQFILSNRNWVELRLVVGVAALVSIGMGLLTGFGISALIGFAVGPIHGSIPYLVLGLGVDDMFVIMSILKAERVRLGDTSLVQIIGTTMKKAGSSITITSVTDIVVFMVGSSTVMPGFRSFCVYATFSILMVYFYVVTFFVAILVLDERRIAEKRNALVPCVVHKTHNLHKRSIDADTEAKLFGFLYRFIVAPTIGKIFVILSVILLTSYSVSQLVLLRQDFSSSWFVPRESNFHQFLMAERTEFPDKSENSYVVIGRIDYASELSQLLELSEQMIRKTDILYDVQSWPQSFETFVFRNYQRRATALNQSEFSLFLTRFLYSTDGGKYRPNIKFDGQLECGEPAPQIKMSTIDFKFRKFHDRDEYLPAKRVMEQLVEHAHFQTGEAYATVWSQSFIIWLANEIVDSEIIRNLLLALLTVMLCTVPLIRDLKTCFWIFICVLLTLVNICGFMHRLGLSLDVVTCVGLQLTAGLCVDYAAHIGHCFLTIRAGSREERARQTIHRIGPAVFCGGVSTLLAFSGLVSIDAYAYQAMFKIFLLVVVFGLFNGIILLPVILSLVGPTFDDAGNKDSLVFTIFQSAKSYTIGGGEAIINEAKVEEHFTPISN